MEQINLALFSDPDLSVESLYVLPMPVWVLRLPFTVQRL